MPHLKNPSTKERPTHTSTHWSHEQHPMHQHGQPQPKKEQSMPKLRNILTAILITIPLTLACGDDANETSFERVELESQTSSMSHIDESSALCPGECSPGSIRWVCSDWSCIQVCNECCRWTGSCPPPPPPPPTCPGECTPGETRNICLQGGCGGCCEPETLTCNDDCQWE